MSASRLLVSILTQSHCVKVFNKVEEIQYKYLAVNMLMVPLSTSGNYIDLLERRAL